MNLITFDIEEWYLEKQNHGNRKEKIAKYNLPTRLKDLNLTVENLSLAIEDVGSVDIMNELPRSMTTDDLFSFIKIAF